ncbi:hypothetical protein HN51_023266 [Arachis hypogaea]
MHHEMSSEERFVVLGYYKQKGVVRKVIDKYVGEIEILESKHVLRVDQEELETVISQVGAIKRGAYDGRVLKAVEYEDICKIAHNEFDENNNQMDKIKEALRLADLSAEKPHFSHCLDHHNSNLHNKTAICNC